MIYELFYRREFVRNYTDDLLLKMIDDTGTAPRPPPPAPAPHWMNRFSPWDPVTVKLFHQHCLKKLPV